MSDQERPAEIVIIRRGHGGDHDDHHGGVWKIAFADFMTAMMAFFLVLWIVNSTSKSTKVSLARYFNPVQLADASVAHKGLENAKASDSDKKGEKSEDAKIEEKKEEQPQKAEPADTKASAEAKGDPKATGKEKEAAKPGAKSDEKKRSEKPEEELPPAPAGPAGGGSNPTHSEAALFRDPYGSLRDIAASLSPEQPAVVGLPSRQSQKEGKPGQEPAPDDFRDPFAAIEPSMNPAVHTAPKPVAKAVELSHSPNKESETAGNNEPALVGKLEKTISDNLSQTGGPAVQVTKTNEGIMIALTDTANFSMFSIGSSEPKPEVVVLLAKVGAILKTAPGNIVLRGHTDGRAYRSGTGDNWRLSASRAQMALYMLARGGIDEKRFERVEGYADRRLKRADAPLAAENRRIEILLRKDGA